ncbi:protein-L-isoaspartate O-methyltransferase [Acetobacteraceae bacterium KSS8]|uniref:Protein-L-isoaspartate O-methyltransferase n=1 Tax=Endosaccharibacter trunci TaxID=2812733 RepID=A0ABT1W686_9PROT|nr:protein-L-isoaspartate O-methyltransferase [Acetobacteraceae bacterium KSS8]
MSYSTASDPAAHALAGAVPDWLIARLQMVDTQIRPVQVSDPRILEAMRWIPRERFVTADRVAVAYMDQNVPLLAGRVLSEPRVIARLIQALMPRGGERALVVGAGTGYAACLLHALNCDVVALEENRTLAAQGRSLLAELAPGVRFHEGALAAGVPEAAPFDFILIDGGVTEIPTAYASQLAENGRVGGILHRRGAVPTAFLAEKQALGLRPRAQFDCAAPLLPELAPTPGFRF